MSISKDQISLHTIFLTKFEQLILLPTVQEVALYNYLYKMTFFEKEWPAVVAFVKPLSHQSGVLTAFPQRLKKLQNAEVRAVQTPATLCRRCGDAVQSPRTPCGGVYFEHAQNKRHGLAFPQRVRQQRCGVF